MVDRWKRLAPLSGVGMVALIVVSFLMLGNSPDDNAHGAKVISYYSSHHGRTNAAAILMAYAIAFAIVYFVSVARYLRSRGANVLAETTVAGGILIGAGLAMGAGAQVALADGVNKFSPSALEAINTLGNNIWWPAVIAGSGIATLGMGVSMLRTGAVPKALGIVTVIVGVVGVAGPLSWFGFLATGPLTLVIAGFVYQRLGQPQAVSMPDVPSQREVTDVPSREKTSS